jgi:hypothetical protein
MAREQGSWGSRARVRIVSVAACIVAACGMAGESEPPSKAAVLVLAATTASTTEIRTAEVSACGTGAHDAHQFAAGCVVCHACGGVYAFGHVTLPGGTSTEGGEIVRGTSGTSCAVACHSQGGSPFTPISWSAVGPLACTSCHTGIAGEQADFRSGHAVAIPADPAAERAGCGGCHLSDVHLSGTVRITDGAGGYVDVTRGDPGELVGACKSCHDGSGVPIAGQTPPLLVGYDDAVAGDFHGARAGTGFGGTLTPGFSRGEGPLACTMCHSAHASANDFVIARRVNGFAIPAGAIDRAGVGAQLLCESCHEGPRHNQCAGCHGLDPMPAGSPCFACHGHEGIVSFPQPWQAGIVYHYDSRWSCAHCHDPGWMPILEYTPPRITTPVNVSDVSGTSAAVSWRTDELATSYVEFGESGVLGRTAGQQGFRTIHAVTLTGLAPGTTYSLRVRTSDRLRNVRLSAIQTFTTVDPFGPPAPTIVPTADLMGCYTTHETATFVWEPVTISNGDPVEYRVEVYDSSALDSPLLESGWLSTTTWSTQVALGAPAIWYWRVRARNAATDIPGPWSIADAFWVGEGHSLGWCDDY